MTIVDKFAKCIQPIIPLPTVYYMPYYINKTIIAILLSSSMGLIVGYCGSKHAQPIETKKQEEITRMCVQLSAKDAVIASNDNTIELMQMQKERLISTMLLLDANLHVMCNKTQSFECTQYRTIITEVMNETIEFANNK